MKLFFEMLVFTKSLADRYKDDECFSDFVDKSLKRFLVKDWGDICEEDKMMNDTALEDGNRILAAYEKENYRIWIILEADRNVLTVLFPEEY